MGTMISSQDNRLYAVPETGYGKVASATAVDRVSVVRFKAKEQNEKVERRDKTGSRTYAGLPNLVRREISYELTTYLSGAQSGQSALLQAALGGSATSTGNGPSIASVSNGGTTLAFGAAHGLVQGQAIAVGGELRFVSTVVNVLNVQINAPFSVVPASGTPAGASVSYRPATDVGSVSLFDYWSPTTAVQRVLSGAAVDKLAIEINGDFHKLTFAGPAAEWIDSASFASGQSGLAAFPPEPPLGAGAMPVPGHLGQAWLGTAPQSRFFTITSGLIELDNNIDLRNREFGSQVRSGVSAGLRTVRVSLNLFASDETSTIALYEAARQRTPVGVMLQLGQQAGQMMGIYLPNVVLETPEFDDSEQRLNWGFVKCRAQGTLNDELFLALG